MNLSGDILCICLTSLICITEITGIAYYAIRTTKGRVKIDLGKQLNVDVGGGK